MWVYGSGFPKSLNIGKAIDKAAGAEREVVGTHRRGTGNTGDGSGSYNFRGRDVVNGSAKMEQVVPITAPATDAAKQWDGYGTALKPAYEPIIVAMKPLVSTFAANALEHGVAGINVDGCRVGTENVLVRPSIKRHDNAVLGKGLGVETQIEPQGRWPANLIHDGSDEVLAGFPVTKSGGGNKAGYGKNEGRVAYGKYNAPPPTNHEIDSGSAARYFYCAKASAADRTMAGQVTNAHPTVKPLALMRYLVRLVTMPENTVILDPFMGSGTTGVACVLEGVGFVGIEQDAESFATAEARIEVARLDVKERLFK